MPNWQVESSRLTVFVAPDLVPPSTLWNEYVGGEPETSVVQRATAAKIEIGDFGEGRLTLAVLPDRIDWVYEAMGVEGILGMPPMLGAFPAAGEPLVRLARRWATGGSFPSCLRIAVGSILTSHTTDRKSGYDELRALVDGVPSNPNATDFMYQVNIPRESHAAVDGLSVNRLSKWAVGLYRRIDIAQFGVNPSHSFSREASYLRLEVDINTKPEFGTLLPGDRIEAIINDLLDGISEVNGGLLAL